MTNVAQRASSDELEYNPGPNMMSQNSRVSERSCRALIYTNLHLITNKAGHNDEVNGEPGPEALST